jgi:hypothetical protein|tara:strand:- start:227 stop:793 length:567 start_codon:yes stop_codon:yes gene_type:complete
MIEHFLLPDLIVDKYSLEKRVYDQYHTWGHFGTGRFKFYTGNADDETLDIVDSIFKDADQIISAVAYNLVNPHGIIGPHSDYGRGCAINIPISGDFKNSSLDSYEYTPPVKVASPAERFKDIPESRFYPHSELEAQLNYEVPICFDTRDPHGVTNSSSVARFILGVTFNEEFTVSSLNTMYKKGQLLK